MSSSRSIHVTSIKQILNSSMIAESDSIVQKKDQRQHHFFRDKFLNKEGIRTRKGNDAGISRVDKAYRKLGRQLSVCAHGNFVVSLDRTNCTIRRAEKSGFSPFNRPCRGTNRVDSGLVSEKKLDLSTAMIPNVYPTRGIGNRMTKAAKARYSSHENYPKRLCGKGNILRDITLNAFKIYKTLQEGSVHRSKGVRATNPRQQAPPHTNLDSQQRNDELRSHLASEKGPQKTLQEEQLPIDRTSMCIASYHKPLKTPQIYIANHSVDSSSNTCQHVEVRAPGSKVQEAREKCNSQSRHHVNGQCLTQPYLPTAYNGCDNVHGDLIVYENDVIRVPRDKIHVLTRERMRAVSQHVDYRVQKRLGQGTFAQVFQCVHLQTGKLVAVKIVKNKTAYTRQASVEVDVLRALGEKSSCNGHWNKSTGQRPNVQNVFPEGSSGNRTKGDYLVDLICYFLYESHLCMVFELLGQNLYDALKQRNFHGFGLSFVRSVIRQAVHGISELAKLGIVHCDIKPENILLVNEGETMPDGNMHIQGAKSVLASVEKCNTTQSSVPGASLNYAETPRTIRSRQLSESQQDGSIGRDTVTTTKNHRIKLIDFGSACFEGQTMQTYIQSRFYRSPEVLIGLPYDSTIDIWSLGCLAAELFLGLPILPGGHEHDQLSRIFEMISALPTWMLDQGPKALIFLNREPPLLGNRSKEGSTDASLSGKLGYDVAVSSAMNQRWKLKSQTEFMASLSEDEIQKKGGLSRLVKQHERRYFKKRKLADIVLHKGQSGSKKEDKYDLDLFVHFLHGLLDPDPRKRWTALQAAKHPFLTGAKIRTHTEQSLIESKRAGNLANLISDLYWKPPSKEHKSGLNIPRSKFHG